MDFQYPLTSDLLTMTSLLRGKASQTMRAEFGMALNEYRIIASVMHKLATSVSSLSEILVVAPCKVSGYVSALMEKSILERSPGKGRAKVLDITSEGVLRFFQYHDAIWETYQEMLAPLSTSQREAFDIGCMYTTTMNDGLHYNGQMPDRVYMCLRAFLLTELLVTETTKGQGLSFNEFRIMFALLQSDESLTPTAISRILLMPKSTLSELVKKLSDRDMIYVAKVDGKTKIISLTEHGLNLATKAALDVDKCFAEGVRSTTKSERAQYVHSAQIIVSHERQHRRTGSLS